jgi:EAL domain-containing protein (putative c-di-GMP-specific phosphodiesterase class I)
LDLENALHNGEFKFFFQPKVSFLTGEITGGEALIRWIKPDGTIVPPNEFIPDAERSGFITDITAVMLPHLIEDIEAIRPTRPDIQIAFNISALDLHSPYLVKMLRSIIGSRRIDPGNIQIEITETVIVDASPRIHASLLDLVALGIEIVMDDYGTGYSSLDLLSRLPFSALKLDQGIVSRMTEDARNTHIVQSSLYMARELSIKTIAEGVESKGAYAFLMASGCNEVQGYLISRPVPRDDFVELCRSGETWPASSIGLLYNAWVNHTSYRRKVLDSVHAMAITEPEDWNGLPKLDLVHNPSRCRLGQWYLSESLTGNASDFMRLEEPHRLMHKAGEHLIRRALGGKDVEPIISGIRVFMEYSDVVDSEVSRIVEKWMERALLQRQ